jgi:hypothetical protein
MTYDWSFTEAAEMMLKLTEAFSGAGMDANAINKLLDHYPHLLKELQEKLKKLPENPESPDYSRYWIND